LVFCAMMQLSLALLGAPLAGVAPAAALRAQEDNDPTLRGEPGIACWDFCDHKGGACPQYCGRPEQWSGSCCELKALGTPQPEECINKGCIGFACCVQDWSEPAPELTGADKAAHKEATEEAAAQAEKAEEESSAQEAEAQKEAAKEQAKKDAKAQNIHAGTPGGECWDMCDMKAGRCPQFCGVPSVWSGSCCKEGATGDQTSEECSSRGCKGYHCCVVDDGGTNPEPTTEAEKEAAKEAEKAAKEAGEKAEKDAKRRASRGSPGENCWEPCDKQAGECPQFCGDPGVWTGACCRSDAELGENKYGGPAAISEDCLNRGCTGFHCCVSDAPTVDAATGAAEVPDAAEVPTCEGSMCEIEEPDGGWEQEKKDIIMPPFGAEGRIDGPEQYGEPASSSSSVKKAMSGLSRRDLRELFKGGKPSNDLGEAGLTVHCFDGTEDYAHPWMPCHDARQQDCSLFNPKTGDFKDWWSTSIINSEKYDTLTTSGIILAPAKTQVLCSWENDMGSLISGCRTNIVEPLPPTELKDMMQRSMSSKRNLYNEVLVNTSAIMANLPHSIAAFVYFDDDAALRVGVMQGDDTRLPDKIVATTAYVGMLDRYKLSEDDIPLLMINRSSPITVMDVSAGARKFLASHSYEQYRKNHPFKKHSDSRTSTERRPNVAEGGNMRMENGDVVTCEKISTNRLIWGDRPCAKSTYKLSELDIPLQKALADSP